ncbi:hypothetical protein ACFFX0_09700 [Citricoccus parietis]|uniref:Uncharacterized protein n=1 Tax=Citricoccus parietis TaxID=592307 RepID=A0ABV5FYZ4_9MICC
MCTKPTTPRPEGATDDDDTRTVPRSGGRSRGPRTGKRRGIGHRRGDRDHRCHR